MAVIVNRVCRRVACTMDNLETDGVIHRSTYVLVHERHMVIRVLRENAEMLNADISDFPKFRGEWYKIAPRCFSGVCEFLRRDELPPRGPL